MSLRRLVVRSQLVPDPQPDSIGLMPRVHVYDAPSGRGQIEDEGNGYVRSYVIVTEAVALAIAADPTCEVESNEAWDGTLGSSTESSSPTPIVPE